MEILGRTGGRSSRKILQGFEELEGMLR